MFMNKIIQFALTLNPKGPEIFHEINCYYQSTKQTIYFKTHRGEFNAHFIHFNELNHSTQMTLSTEFM